jgi:hypothetical protein
VVRVEEIVTMVGGRERAERKIRTRRNKKEEKKSWERKECRTRGIDRVET